MGKNISGKNIVSGGGKVVENGRFENPVGIWL
jgi:hypothetical protein